MRQVQISVPVEFELVGKLYGPINVAEVDDLYYLLERVAGTGSLNTAVLEFGQSLTTSDEPHGWATANLGTTSKHTLDVSTFAYLWLRVDAIQAGQSGILHMYMRSKPCPNGA
jgi:hypothetical protein